MRKGSAAIICQRIEQRVAEEGRVATAILNEIVKAGGNRTIIVTISIIRSISQNTISKV